MNGNINIVIGSWGSYNECNERALGSKWLDLSNYSDWDEIVEEIKKEVKPSIREKLALNVAKIQREEAERKQLNKGRSHSSDLEL